METAFSQPILIKLRSSCSYCGVILDSEVTARDRELEKRFRLCTVKKKEVAYSLIKE